MGSRRLILLVGAAAAAGVIATDSIAQSVEASASAPRGDPQPAVNIDAATLRARAMPGHLGLKSPASANSGLELPLGLQYRNDTSSVIKPFDDKNGWSLGVGLNLNSSRTVELSPSSSLGLQPKPAPGFLLEKRF